MDSILNKSIERVILDEQKNEKINNRLNAVDDKELKSISDLKREIKIKEEEIKLKKAKNLLLANSGFIKEFIGVVSIYVSVVVTVVMFSISMLMIEGMEGTVATFIKNSTILKFLLIEFLGGKVFLFGFIIIFSIIYIGGYLLGCVISFIIAVIRFSPLIKIEGGIMFIVRIMLHTIRSWRSIF